MNNQPCPTCGNPAGMTLKDALARQNRVMPFVTKHEALRTKFQQWEINLNGRDTKITETEKDLRRRKEKLESDEVTLSELLAEARRPEQEFEQLRRENQELQQNLVTEEQNRKKAEDALAPIRKELSSIKKSSRKLSRDLNKVNSELGDLQIEHRRVSELLGSANAERTLLKRKNSEISTQNSILQGTTKSLEGEVGKLREENGRKAQRIEKLELELSSIQGVVSPFSITDLDLLHALSNEVTDLFASPSEIVTLGSGPFSVSDFDRYLNSLGVTPRADGCSWIIVGRENWTKDNLNHLIDSAGLRKVRVFSQELFVAGFLTTHDPFSLPLEILMKFAKGHPAIQYLIHEGFKWPEVTKRKATGTGRWDERKKESPLTLMGYHVGETKNLSKQVRRSKLKSVYFGDLKSGKVKDMASLSTWGRPNSAKRLEKMAYHIHDDIKTNATKGWARAIKEWKEDLDWLKSEFYTNRMRFKWPNG